jgi:protein-S-isoprenylcysteine O-methyltransferase Ste14
MTTASEQPRQMEPTDRRRLVLATIFGIVFYILCLFLPSGSWAWSRGWLFLCVFIGTMVLVAVYLKRVNPEVITARINRHGGTKRWDLILMCFLYPTYILALMLASLDDGRFHWSHAPWWVCGVGYVLLIVGIAGVTWAESVNKYFERTVRIQTDRGHTVVDTGPYAVVRHPGYVAASLLILGMPLCLGSYWALIPAVVSCLLLVVRTRWEDQTLQGELLGYKEYAQRVRYRLIPSVW